MKLAEAKAIAENILKQLEPHCERIAIAGSIRREKPEVKDIEIVAIPKPYETGLFESGIATVVNIWEKVKGELPCKYTQRILPEGIKLDLFFATKDNWGFQFAVRTGSAEFSHKILAVGWVRNGFHAEEGILVDDAGNRYPVQEEKELFYMSGTLWREPKDRELA